MKTKHNATLNIGLNVGDHEPANSAAHTVLQLLEALGDHHIHGLRIVPANANNPERTLVAQVFLEGPIWGPHWGPRIHGLASVLGQDCIAVAPDCPFSKGKLIGPRAKKWLPYNEHQFIY